MPSIYDNTSPLLDALLRDYPQYESNLGSMPDPGWGPMFDETYQTPGQQQRSDAIQAYLAKRFDLDPSTQLTPDQWQEQLMLAQIQNDYAAMAGKGQSVKGAGYLTESPQSAQQNALRYAWEDEWAKRLGTANYDPRYAQGATSFAPNQFSPTSGVYIDPFMQEGPMGALREQGSEMRRRPSWTSRYTGETRVGGQPTGMLGQWVQSAAGIPEIPQGATAKGISKYFEERDKQKQAYLDMEMKERRKQAQQIADEQRKTQNSIDRKASEYTWKLRNDPMSPYNVKFTDPKKQEEQEQKFYNHLADYHSHFGTSEWKAFLEMSGGDPEIAKQKYSSFLRGKQDPQYRRQVEQAARQRQQSEEIVTKLLQQAEKKKNKEKGLPRTLGLPVRPQYGQVMRGEAELPPMFPWWPSASMPPPTGRDPFDWFIQESIRRQREGI